MHLPPLANSFTPAIRSDIRHHERRVVRHADRSSRLRDAFAGGLMICAAIGGFTAPAACFPWSIDMFRGPGVQPLSVAPRAMPPGTLPVKGGMPEMNLEQMTISLHNPLKPTPATLAHGKELFLNNCAVCHGADGQGDGTVAFLITPKPKNLVSGTSKNLPDGYIYGYIRDGGIRMPSYDDAMSSDERWQVVMYVRQLQAGGSGTAQSSTEQSSGPASKPTSGTK